MKWKIHKLNVQFHMLPDELLAFVQEMAAKHGLNLCLERWFPKRTFDVPAGASLQAAVGTFGYPNVIWLVMDGLEPKGRAGAERGTFYFYCIVEIDSSIA